MIKAIDRLIELEEEETRRQRQRTAFLAMMDMMVEALPDALVVTDQSGKIVLFNERAELMFGYNRSEMLGAPVENLLPERCRQRHVERRELFSRFNITERQGRMGNATALVALHRDGHEFQVDITLSRAVLPKGVLSLSLARYSERTVATLMPERAATTPMPLQQRPRQTPPEEPDQDGADAG